MTLSEFYNDKAHLETQSTVFLVGLMLADGWKMWFFTAAYIFTLSMTVMTSRTIKKAKG